eukprot:CAMPEP_0113686664 /NCGR_PEP_ID=MMETSP0038_2-20120614/15427_1 /TAXON_ID=2898 /ORGANISM="Cryptomonas paramecium" /LENGTH=975 /DNA_ID=CAMNT_0000607035 /DNA_START=18 /DNA_END=2945 /DNA_ORIENTATION=- /assembly_acc=CAM_ASM_000170
MALEWPAAKVRSTFIEFFQSKDEKEGKDGGHTFWPSSGVVPFDDPTLLFTNAGMNQFKPIFMGTVDPKSPLAPLKRAANSQKCIRAGGKHNDLDDVGKDVYHHTFFEMLGNWSFATYFKKEAISWAWELLTKVYGLAPDRLYATYCEGDVHKGGIVEPDEETRQLWLQFLPEDRVLKGNMKDNFWEMGETGPCGPCTELHYDRIGGRQVAHLVNQDDPNVLEIWNLVFIQMFRNKDQSLTMLPGKHVDTGMGMERITSILQQKMSNYDTDIFTPIFSAIQAKTGIRPYSGKVGKDDVDGVDMAYRVVADHIRTLTIAITDGAIPGNEGRNYVIRRILRRGVRYARQYLYPAGTNYEPGFFAGLTSKVVEILGGAFPELQNNPGTNMTPEKVAQVILEEEVSFLRTLDKGISQFEKFAAEDKASGKISGPHAFMLYDTFGFPLDLTVLMAEEKGMVVDKAGYEECMAEQRARSRGEGKAGDKVITLEAEQTDKLAKELAVSPTDDSSKFSWVSKGSGPRVPATVKAVYDGKNFLQEAPEGELVGVVTDVTPFYAESGGQLFDTGKITTADGTVFVVSNVQKFGAYILHIGSLNSGSIKVGGKVDMEVDFERRALCAANHTSTHLLNWALRKVLAGHQIDQRGSIVGPDKLRFDFSYGKPLKTEELDEVQTLVRELIRTGSPVQRQEVALAAAKQVKTLRAVFGEVYPDPVRVVSVGPVAHTINDLLATPDKEDWMRLSVEFCGGTHMDNTAEAGTFTIISEEGTAKGVRRLTAYTREAARAAQDAAAEFEKRVDSAGEIKDVAALDAEISAMRMDVDAVVMDYVRKDGIKKKIDALKDRVLAAEKEQLKIKTEAAVQWAETLTVAEGTRYLVQVVDVDGDTKAVDAAMKALNARVPELPVILLSRSAGGDKVSGLAVVPASRAAQADAREWVNAALEHCGGKGGGKPDRAQGAAKDAAGFDKAVKAAQDFAAAKLK